MHSYLAIKTAISLLTGLLIFIWLTILGVDYAVLWGLIAFLLNFVPTVGSFIAAVPAVLLAAVQLGIFPAGLTLGGFVVVNLVMGNMLEPRWMGKGLNLSPLVVFVSLVLWGWVLGPSGHVAVDSADHYDQNRTGKSGRNALDWCVTRLWYSARTCR